MDQFMGISLRPTCYTVQQSLSLINNMALKQQQSKAVEDTPPFYHNMSITRLIPTSLLLILISLLATQAMAQAPQIQAHTAYQIIPEGAFAVISFEPSIIAADDSVTLDLSIEGDGASQASLSANSITLTSGAPKAQVTITVADNSDTQGTALAFTVGFTHNSGTLVEASPGLPPALTFTIPPNDLRAEPTEELPDIIMGNS